MKSAQQSARETCFTMVAFCLTVIVFPCWQSLSLAESLAPPLSAQEQLRLGERMYREGVLPSGRPMRVSLKGEPPAPGTSYGCEGCHLRGGLGSFVDGVYVPPVNGAQLFQPMKIYSSPSHRDKPFAPPQVDQQYLKQYQVRRPVYTGESLARALRSGVNSAGRIMSDSMPRYQLENGDMELLVSYLRKLSSEPAPGVSDTELRFATVVGEDVSPAEQNAMLIPLENFFRGKNLANFANPQQGGLRSRSAGFRSRIMTETSLANRGVAIRQLSLSRWVLKGAPDTWRSQLEEYYRKEPVFALVGGLVNGPWHPVHQFCEEHRIPDIFPSTDFPVISHSDWYTLYLSKGYYQEGVGAADFLNDSEELKGQPVIQIVRDTLEGRALSRGFLETRQESGQKAPVTVTLKPEETLTAQLLQGLLAREKPGALILWDGPESLNALEMLAAEAHRSATVLVSSSFLGTSMFFLGEKVRPFTYLTYPYGISQLPGEKTPSLMSGLKSFNAQANALPAVRIAQRTYILTLIMDMALADMRGNYYRDNLLDVIGSIMDQDVQLYDHISFGPGQRYASRGCYVVQLSKSGLVKKSLWLTH